MAGITTSDAPSFDLDRWLEPSGPVTTVWLPTPSATAEARERLRLEWKNARTEVAATAPEATLAAIDEALDDPGAHAEGDSVVVLARDGEVALVGLDVEVPAAHARTGPVPHLTPVLAARQAAVPHLVVVADRVGADILAVGPGGEVDESSVDGDTEHIARSAPGGWSQRRFQQRAENTWERNAGEVAEVVERLRRQVGARLVVVVGDERAVQFLTEHASTELSAVVEVIDGAGRNDPDPFDAVSDDVARLVSTVVASDTVDVLERFGAARSEAAGREAVDGPAATMEMLGQGRVRLLLVTADEADERTAFLDPGTGQLSPDPETLAALGLDSLEADLVDAAVWAALRTGAEVRLVPGHGSHAPGGGLGGLLDG